MSMRAPLCCLGTSIAPPTVCPCAAWLCCPLPAASCPKCQHSHAYFMQIQIRSADEPMTMFFKCCNPTCNHRWREG